MSQQFTKCTLKNVKALAYHYGNKNLSMESLAKSVLTFTELQIKVARKLSVNENYLDKFELMEYPIPKNIDSIKWPEFFYTSKDSFLDDNEQPEPVVTDLNFLLNVLVLEVKREFWFKKKYIEDNKQLVHLLNKSIILAADKFPYYNELLVSLKHLLFRQLYDSSLSCSDDIPLPIFICTNPDNNLIPVFQKIANGLGYKFRFFNDGASSSEDYFSADARYPLSFTVIRFTDQSYELSSEIQKMLTYYETGYFYQQAENNTDITFLSLCDESKNVEIEVDDFFFKHHIFIFLLHIDSNIILDKSLSAEQISSKVLKHYENYYKTDQYERIYYLYYKYKNLLALVKSENLLFFDYGNKQAKIKEFIDYTTSLLSKLKKFKLIFNQTDVNKLVLLSILKIGNYDVERIKYHLRHTIYMIEEILLIQEAFQTKKHIVFQNSIAAIDYVLTPKIINAITNEMLMYCENQFHKLNLKVFFDLGYDASTDNIVFKDIHAQQMLKEGSFITERPTLRFKDVVGCQEMKKRFQMIIDYYKHKDSFVSKGIKITNRMLLIGAPGTGKTILAQAFAGEIGFPFYAISASELTSQKWAGWGASLLREIFLKAKNNSPSVLFLDEIDALGKRSQFTDNDGGVGYDARSILNSLLVLMDGVEDNSDVIIIGATNRPEDLDEALLRSKRFGMKFKISNLSPEERERLIKMHLSASQCNECYDDIVNHIKTRTYGDFTPAKIVEIIEETKLYSIIEKNSLVTVDDFDFIIDKFMLGEKIKRLDPSFKKSVAIHEAGHAVAHRLFFPEKSIFRLSVGMRESTTGITLFSNDNESKELESVKNTDLINHIIMTLAGMQAEKIKFAHWDLGSGQDFLMATELSRIVACNIDLGYGFKPAIDYSLGTLNLASEHLSEDIRDIIFNLIEVCADKAHDLLVEHWNYVESLAVELEKKEDLSMKDINHILKGLPVIEGPVIRTFKGKNITI
jgi:cell division protease FtsH